MMRNCANGAVVCADKRGKEGIGGRYAVFDVQYDIDDGTRNKISTCSFHDFTLGSYARH